jgi:hypothetical protein
MSEQQGLNRSLTIGLISPKEKKQVVLNSIRRYRAICRQCFSIVLLAQTAGSEIQTKEDTIVLAPQSEKAKNILATVMGRDGKVFAYSLRDFVLQEQWPTAYSFVWDSLRRDLEIAWKTKDPEFPRASRGWLVLQGARNITQFNRRGIGFAVARGKPVGCTPAHHRLELRWDHDIGPVVFQVPKLDRHRWLIWRNLVNQENGHEFGTLYLNERDGLIQATITYKKPAQETEVDPGRTCTVTFGTGDKFIEIQGPDHSLYLSDAEVVAWLKRLEARRIALEKRRAACGNPRRPWGHRKGWLATQDVISRLTKQRENGQKDRNHAFTRRIVDRAFVWHCGRIEVGPFPADLSGKPWQWAQFRMFLNYKAQEKGIKIVYFDPEEVEVAQES